MTGIQSNLATRQAKQHRHLALVLLPVLAIAPFLLGTLLQQRHTRCVIQQHVGECRREEGQVGKVAWQERRGTGRGGAEGVETDDGEAGPEGDLTGVTFP